MMTNKKTKRRWINKTLVVLALSLPNFILYYTTDKIFPLLDNYFLFVGFPFLLPFISFIAQKKRFEDQSIDYPKWSMDFREHPFSFTHFLAVLSVAVGGSISIATFIRCQCFTLIGLSSFSFGLGILLGLYVVTHLLMKKKSE